MLNRLMTPREQLTLLFVGVALVVGGLAYYFAAARQAEVPVALDVIADAALPSSRVTAPTESHVVEPAASGTPTPRDAVSPIALETPEALVPEEGESAPTTAAVAIMGAVGREGLFRVPVGTRVGDLIDRAGGTTELADLSDINLGARVIDGTTLTIPALPSKRAADGSIQLRNNAAQVVNPPAYTRSQSAYLGAPPAPGSAAPRVAASPSQSPVAPGGLINLNTATQADLETLPGIGPAFAQRIIEFRAHGAFQSVDDLDAVPGIGAKRLEQLRPLVTVQ